MTLTSSQVRVAGSGELFLAAVGTTLPAAVDEQLDPAFTGLGYTTEDGVALTNTVDRTGITAWQSLTPVRYIYTGRELTIGATFEQSNAQTIKMWLGSGDFAPDSSTGFRADIPVDPMSQQYVAVLEWHDGLIVNRLVVEKVELTDTADVALKRDVSGIGLTFGALAPDSGSVLASWLTNDPAFAPAA